MDDVAIVLLAAIVLIAFMIVFYMTLLSARLRNVEARLTDLEYLVVSKLNTNGVQKSKKARTFWDPPLSQSDKPA